MNRRDFVSRLTAAGTVGLLGLRPRSAETEPPPETTRLRVARFLNELKKELKG